MEIFGSAARAVDFNRDASDVDFLVEFHRNSPLPPLEQFFGLAEALKQLLGRPVDLLESGAARFAIRSFWRESTARAGSSMQRESRAYLWDVDRAAAAIERFVAGLDLQTYEQSEIVHSAVERKFEIIGESSINSRKDPALASRIPRIQEIVAFRNLLIHGYAFVEHARVLRIAHEALPALRSAIAALIMELGGWKE